MLDQVGSWTSFVSNQKFFAMTMLDLIIAAITANDLGVL